MLVNGSQSILFFNRQNSAVLCDPATESPAQQTYPKPLSNEASSAAVFQAKNPVMSEFIKIEQDGQVLYISRKAQEKMKELETFLADMNYALEVGGSGLTRQIDEKTILVEDFIFPDKEKCFFFKEFMMNQFSGALMELMQRGKPLYLYREDENIIVTNGEKRLELDDFGYSFIDNYLKQLNQDQNLDLSTFKNLKETIDDKKIPLKSDWELVANTTRVIIFGNYFTRLYDAAFQSGLDRGFDMHFHPMYGFLALACKQNGADFTNNLYTQLLRFSSSDLKAFADHNTQWAEIRALGIPEDLGNHSTSRFYHIPTVLKIAQNLGKYLEEIMVDNYSNLPKLIELLKEVDSKKYDTKALLEYVFEDDKARVEEASKKIELVYKFM